MRCLICIGHFPHECPVISGSFVKNDLRLKASYGSSPPYIKEFIAMIKCMYICIPMSHIPNVCIYTFQMYVYIHSNVTHSHGNWIHENASNFLECKCVKFSGEKNISTIYIGMYTYIHTYICIKPPTSSNRLPVKSAGARENIHNGTWLLVHKRDT